jgi:hypothetical protein
MANANKILVDEILADTYTDAQLDAVGEVAGSFTYMATILAALADHVGGLDDLKGQQMLLEFSARMAEHEATIV